MTHSAENGPRPFDPPHDNPVYTTDALDKRHSAGNDAPVPEGRTIEEWGVEQPWGIEWRASVGMSHRYEYTAESVWGLANGKPVYRRLRTIYRDHLTEPERVLPPGKSDD